MCSKFPRQYKPFLISKSHKKYGCNRPYTCYNSRAVCRDWRGTSSMAATGNLTRARIGSHLEIESLLSAVGTVLPLIHNSFLSLPSVSCTLYVKIPPVLFCFFEDAVLSLSVKSSKSVINQMKFVKPYLPCC